MIDAPSKDELVRRARARAALEARQRPYVPHIPSSKQRTFLMLSCTEALYGGAAAGGKTDALLMQALAYVDSPGYHVAIFRRSIRESDKSSAILARAREWLAPFPDVSWNEAKKTFAFPSGATIEFAYLSGPRDHEMYQGAEYQAILFDELTHFAERQYLYLRSRLRRRPDTPPDVPLLVRSATNPGSVGHDWVRSRFEIPEMPDPSEVYYSSDNRRAFVPALYSDNPACDPEYVTQLEELDPTTKAQLLHGFWVRDATGVVYSSLREDNIQDAAPEHGEGWRYILGIDYGFNDETAFCVVSYHPEDPKLYVLESEKHQRLDPHSAAERTRALIARFGGFDRIVADTGGLGKGYAEYARQRFTLPIEPAEKRGKLGYIKLLNGELHNGSLVIVRHTNEALLSEMRSLIWRDDTQREEHPSFPNHLCDALLYAWRDSRHYRGQPKEQAPKPGSTAWAKAEEERMRELVKAKHQPKQWWQSYRERRDR